MNKRNRFSVCTTTTTKNNDKHSSVFNCSIYVCATWHIQNADVDLAEGWSDRLAHQYGNLYIFKANRQRQCRSFPIDSYKCIIILLNLDNAQFSYLFIFISIFFLLFFSNLIKNSTATEVNEMKWNENLQSAQYSWIRNAFIIKCYYSFDDIHIQLEWIQIWEQEKKLTQFTIKKSMRRDFKIFITSLYENCANITLFYFPFYFRSYFLTLFCSFWFFKRILFRNLLSLRWVHWQIRLYRYVTHAQSGIN